MNRLIRSGFAATFAAVVGLSVVFASPAAHAQDDANAQKRITLDLRDAPIRSALEQLFASARADFSIDNSVQGFVTLKVTDQPFESALRLILRSASSPLTFTRENNVYIIRPRTIASTNGAPGAAGPDAPPEVDGENQRRQGQLVEQINLTYADPFDLAPVFGIQLLPVGTRGDMMGGMGGMMGGMGGMMGGMGGGMMGGMGGMMGGMGGFGGGGFGGMMGGGMGGMGGGMMGGGMMGGGMMGGGMMGGMGGFGGGRGF